MENKIAIIGTGNLGKAIADGLLISKLVNVENLTLTRRNTSKLKKYSTQRVKTTSNNIEAVKNSDIIILAVKPHKFEGIVSEIVPYLTNNHLPIKYQEQNNEFPLFVE